MNSKNWGKINLVEANNKVNYLQEVGQALNLKQQKSYNTSIIYVHSVM